MAPKTEWDPQYHNDFMSKSRLFHVRLTSLKLSVHIGLTFSVQPMIGSVTQNLVNTIEYFLDLMSTSMKQSLYVTNFLENTYQICLHS